MIFVRAAEQEDILTILELLKEFADTLPLAKKHFYAPSVSGLIKYSIVNGCCLVAVEESDDEEKIIGAILGAVAVNPWTRHSREMREIGWWVTPEYRKTKAGYKLYERYSEISREMIEDKIISASFMTTLENSGKAVESLVSQNFNRSETHYTMGG